MVNTLSREGNTMAEPANDVTDLDRNAEALSAHISTGGA